VKDKKDPFDLGFDRSKIGLALASAKEVYCSRAKMRLLKSQRAILYQRRVMGLCKACSPNAGMRVRLIDGYVFLEPCRACGGHSRAFLEDRAGA